MNKLILIFLFSILSLITNAQNAEMADAFRQDGKIYVVIAVLAVVFISIVLMLFII
ncbi:MAG: CcmD family protein [Bacteroidia bacterium]|nr:CcmD family protein [Bacteroidia bacterium]